MLGWKVEKRRLLYKKIGFRYEYATFSLSIWWFNKRYTVHRYRGSQKDMLLKLVKRMGWRKQGNLA